MSRERQTLLLADGLQVAALAVALIFIVSVLAGCASPVKLMRGNTADHFDHMNWYAKATVMKF